MTVHEHAHHPDDLHRSDAGPSDTHERHEHPGGHDDGGRGEPLELDVQPWGPTADDVARLSERLLAHSAVRELLGDAEHRLISLRLADPERKSESPCPPDRFRATIYDYTNGRTLRVTGDLATLDEASPGAVEIEDVADEPLPSAEEFAAAVEVVRHDRELRVRLAAGDIQAYQPMPPLLSRELDDGRIDRAVTVALREQRGEQSSHRIYGVDLFGRHLEILDRFDFPPLEPCEPPPSAEGCPTSGTAGQVTVTVTQGGQTVWRFVVVRPAASSGTNGSGIELRYVDYRGKRVLYRAHVPILNVEYVGGPGGCGPTYRDWQDSEACFQASGTDVSPGFRLCPSPAQTLLDSGVDSGNFRGVAIYVQGQDVVLVSELTAGWYRYISEWRLNTNGTIRPIFGFAATDNPCTCSTHIHHAYWRFDFDIRTAWNNNVEEFNDPPLFGSSNWHAKSYEIRRVRDPSRKRAWRVSNAATGEGYVLTPGIGDGTADAYGVGDLWVLRYDGAELDDGQGFTTDPALSRANLDKFKTPAQQVSNTDVLLWYAGHFRHDQAHAAGHRVGPELRPVNW
jgi:hypothetical protein